MLTRIEIDGFKSFEDFSIELRPFTAIVGPNASGKSNLFDALRFLSLLCQHDVRSAMQDLRGEPEELFRQTSRKSFDKMKFAVEVMLDSEGQDSFGTPFILNAQRLRYELELGLQIGIQGQIRGIVITYESCDLIHRKDEKAAFVRKGKLAYSTRKTPFLETVSLPEGGASAFLIRQDGRVESGTKRGRPVTIPASEATRSALSTINTAEFPHLYALKQLLAGMRFLEINPQAARRPSDRFEVRYLKPDASNLSAVLASLKDETATDLRPDGVISDISADLTSLIPLVQSVQVHDDPLAKEVSFSVVMDDKLRFSSRVISDGTIRLLALLALLDDPKRKGVLCFEEPENGVHEGRIASLVSLLRESATDPENLGFDPFFQVLLNTHSPAVMEALLDDEIAVADTVSVITFPGGEKSYKTRMRTGVETQLDMLDPETQLTRGEVNSLLRRQRGFV